MFRYLACFVAFACICSPAFCVLPYGRPLVVAPRVAVVPRVVPAAQAIVPRDALAQAQALTDAAGAKATAVKINSVNLEALNNYGHQIGVPLLVRPYGSLTNLYAAGLPPRSFVGKIDPAFQRNSYTGKLEKISETSIGVLAV
ncbi:chorion protein S16 [Teleopsis dalmanni]|uniref:chorion protein S16 n=1 Tax=Teleopsis dalmanni TaxID=139649 RepID=UPI0018CFD53F|nr:chorion protein S16 [Teleopsis dalmanni]